MAATASAGGAVPDSSAITMRVMRSTSSSRFVTVGLTVASWSERAERARDELGQRVRLDGAGAPREVNGQIRGELEHHLPAGAARRRRVVGAGRDGDGLE